LSSNPLRVLLLYAASRDNRSLSYQVGWPKHFLGHPRFRCRPLNVLARRPLVKARAAAALRRRFDAVVVLHSAFSNACYVEPWLAERLGRMRQPKAYFVGNEYKLMPEKMSFCEALGVDLLVSQLSSPAAHDLYRERLGCEVVPIPSGGLDTDLFAPRTPLEERPIELGYRAHDAPAYLGHQERREVADRFLAAAPRHGLRADISLDPGDRFDEPGWAGFLDSCRAQLGSEAGGDYFELDDRTRKSVIAYLADRPQASFDEIYDRFYRDYPNPVSGRALSGRIVEAAGTKTVQLLLEGDYGGYFRPDEHYVAIRKDFSNVDAALDQLRDEALCRALVEKSHRVAVEELAYARLIDRFHAALTPLVL
jgi:hypothetical protein